MRKGRFTVLLLSGVAVGWLLLASVYFLVLNPQHFAAGRMIVERAAQLGCALLIFFVAVLLGEALLKRLKFELSSSLEKTLFSLGAGLWIISLSVLILGALGIMGRNFYFILILAVVGFSWRRVKNLIGRILSSKKKFSLRPLGFAFLLFLLLTLLGSFAPPISYDALEYHLGGPSTYIREGRFIFLPYNVYANFPALTEMLYLLGMILKDDIAAKLIHFLFGVASAAAVYQLTRSFFSKWTAPLSSLIFYSYAQVSLLSSQAYVDLALTFFLVLTLYAFLRWVNTGEAGWLILSGFMSGAAASVKYSGLIFCLLIFGMGIIIKELSRREIKLMLKNIFVFGGIALVVFSPWLVKNLIYTTNPLYPFFQPLLGGGWNNVQYAKFLFHHKAPPAHFLEFLSSASAPWRISFSEGRISPFFLLFSPFSLILFFARAGSEFRERTKRTLAIILGYSAVYYFLWLFFTHHNIRFLVPLSAVAAPLAALGFYSLTKIRGAKFFAYFILGLGLIYNFYLSALLVAERVPLRVVTGRETKSDYLLKRQPHYAAIKFMNENLPPDARILFIGEARVHYIERDVLANTVFDKSLIGEILRDSEGPDEVRERMRERRITHVFLNELEIERLKENYGYLADINWEEFKRYKFLRELFSAQLPEREAGVYVYEIK